MELEKEGIEIEKGSGRRLVIPDIHGCFKTFKAMINQIKLTSEDQLFLLGDYIDRGPNSSGVLNFILALIADGYHIYPLRGNHEQMLLNMSQLHEKELIEHCEFYRIEDLISSGSVKIEYLEFLNDLPYYYILDKFILVHAGLNLEIPDPMKDLESMLWIRNFPVNKKKLKGRKIIHGHNPTAIYTIKQQIKKRGVVIPLDNGCVLRNHIIGMGNLLCLDLDSWELTILKNVEI